MNVLCSLLLVITTRRTFATHSKHTHEYKHTQHSPLYQHFTLALITTHAEYITTHTHTCIYEFCESLRKLKNN